MSLPLERVEELLKQFNQRNAGKGVTLELAKTREELEEVVQVVGRAFVDYPLYGWMLDSVSSEDYQAISIFFARYVQRECRTDGFIIMAKDDSGRIIGAAQTSHQEHSDYALLRKWHNFTAKVTQFCSMFFGRTGYPRAFRSGNTTLEGKFQCFDQIDTAHKEIMGELTHHLYLIMLATEPSLKGKGVGKTLLAALGEIADSINVPIYLETAAGHLKAFYERNGYENKRIFTIKYTGGDFSPNFSMVRPAKASSSEQLTQT